MLFFIVSGKIKLYSDSSPFIKYNSGDIFGDQDTLLDLPRDGKAITITHLYLKVLSMEQFIQLSNNF